MAGNGKIVFSEILNSTIFDNDFTNFSKNNVIDFGNKPVVILYAPNGVGKTSLARALDGMSGTHFKAMYANQSYDTDNSSAILFREKWKILLLVIIYATNENSSRTSMQR